MAATIAYVPSTLSSTLGTHKVVQIIAAAHEPDTLQAQGTKQTNHWVFYLTTSQNASIRLDLSPTSATTGIACLIVRKLDYIVSANAVKTCNLPVNGDRSVKSIIDLLQTRHYDRYKFAPGGQGCRYWVDSVLALLHEHQITAQNETQVARAAILKVWGTGGTLLPAADQTDIVPGTFY